MLTFAHGAEIVVLTTCLFLSYHGERGPQRGGRGRGGREGLHSIELAVVDAVAVFSFVVVRESDSANDPSSLTPKLRCRLQ